MSRTTPVVAQGKKLLMKAALRMSARVGSIGSLGLRELAREAGVDPTTFYRHFKSFDELGLAVMQGLADQLRPPLRELRRKAAETSAGLGHSEGSSDEVLLAVRRLLQALTLSVKLVFDTVEKQPDAFAAGARELRGSLPSLRKAIRQMMADFAADLAEDVRTLGLLPMLDDATIDEVSLLIIQQLFQFTADYVEQRSRRAEIRSQAESFVLMLVVGAVVTRSMGRTPEQAVLKLLQGQGLTESLMRSRGHEPSA